MIKGGQKEKEKQDGQDSVLPFTTQGGRVGLLVLFFPDHLEKVIKVRKLQQVFAFISKI